MTFERMFVDKMFKYGFILVIALILADLLTYFYYPNTIFSDIFLATREQTPLTWISVIILFLIGISSAVLYKKTGKKIWYFLSLTYLFFSLDDAIYFHERVSGALQNHIQALNFFPTYSWVIFYFPLLIFGLGGMVYMLWRNASTYEKRLLLFATFLLFLALFLDIADGFVEKNNGLVFCIDTICNKNVAHIFRLTEEVFEVVGLGIIGYLNLLNHYK